MEPFYELTNDSVTLRPILYPYKLFGRFYEISTLGRLLEEETPMCPYSRKPFNIDDIEKPNMFEEQVFELVKNETRATSDERNLAKHNYILFMRKYGWNVEAAKLGDMESMVPASLDLLSENKLVEARKFALKASRFGNLFAFDVLGHTSMLEKKYAEAHEHFSRCWGSPTWTTKDRTAYYIAECYYEREMYKHALRWAKRASDLGLGSQAATMCVQIYYLQKEHIDSKTHKFAKGHFNPY
jgi:hypothetical protein